MLRMHRNQRDLLLPKYLRGSIALLLGVTCMAAESTASGETIAVFTKNLVNQNYAALRLGVDRAVAAMGGKTYHRVPAKPDDPTEQIAMLDALSSEKPDAIIFNPADIERLAGPFKAVERLGIPVINIVNRAAYADKIAFVGADDELIGYATAQYLLNAMGEKANVVILEGPPSATTSVDRSRGFVKALKEHPSIHVVASANAKYLQPEAVVQMRAVLATGVPIDGIIAANDLMALGSLEALTEAGRAQGVKVVGINGIPQAISAVESGRLLATEDYSGFKLGCIAGMAAIRHLRGLPVPRTINLPVQMIDKTNYTRWKVPLEQQQCLLWEELVR